MATILQDLKHAFRMLAKNPAFTAVAVLTLALGIGANTAIFSVVNAVLLRPLPYEEPSQLVKVWSYRPQVAERSPLCVADFLDWRSANHAFQHVAAYGYNLFSFTGKGTPARVLGAAVTADFFSTFGVNPSLGRTFMPDEDRPGSAPVVVVSRHFWERRLGSDRNAVGHPITLNGVAYTLVGVMPANFEFPESRVEVWTALTLDPPTRRAPYFLQGVARLNPGVSLTQANVEMAGLAHRIQQDNPNLGTNWGFTIVSLRESVVGDVRQTLLVLLGTVGFVLLISLSNVANLFLAKASTRQKELAVRAALGASRRRLILQTLTEGILLSLAGGLLGLILAHWGIDLLLALEPQNVPRLSAVGIDGWVLGFTAAVSLLGGVLFSLFPALGSARLNLIDSLKESGRGSTEGFRGHRLRGALVVAEVSLALIVMVGAGLMINALRRLQRVNAGFNSANLLTMQIGLPDSSYAKPEQKLVFSRRLIEGLRALPGVQTVGLGTARPPDNEAVSDYFTAEGQPQVAANDTPVAGLYNVSPDYFKALGVPLLKGRYFTDADSMGALSVAIINETLARKYFPNQDPIGKHIKEGGAERPNNPWMTIVGVVGDVKYVGLNNEADPGLYLSYLQGPWPDAFVYVRTSNAPLTLGPAVQSVVWSLDKNLPVDELASMDQIMSKSVSEPRFRSVLLGAFATVALLLAAIGIYGVMSYMVNERTHEMGIRMALGAQPSNVLRLVVGRGALLTGAGVCLGLIASIVLTRFLASLLFEVKTNDFTTFALSSVLLSATALAACYVPARRATKVDPLVALRHE
jgi:predicted permease